MDSYAVNSAIVITIPNGESSACEGVQPASASVETLTTANAANEAKSQSCTIAVIVIAGETAKVPNDYATADVCEEGEATAYLLLSIASALTSIVSCKAASESV